MSVNTKMTALANAIRAKTGQTGLLTLDEMETAVAGIYTGVELPELSNPAAANEIFLGEEVIDGEGNKMTGTFTIEGEISELNTLISQLKNTVDGLPDAGSRMPNLQDKVIEPTTSLQTIKADNGYDGLDTVTINAIKIEPQALPSISVSSSGLITASVTQSVDGYVQAGTKYTTKQLTTQAAQTIIPTTSDQTIASGRYLTGTQIIKGDANLIPANIISGKSIFGVTGSYVGSAQKKL